MYGVVVKARIFSQLFIFLITAYSLITTVFIELHVMLVNSEHFSILRVLRILSVHAGLRRNQVF